MHFLCFSAVFELMSDSHTAIQVEPLQCPLHQSILLSQGPIHDIFEKYILRIGGAGKLTFCLVFSFFVFGYWVFQKYLFLFFINGKTKDFHMRQLFFCTMDGFLRVLKKALFQLICTRLYTQSFFWSYFSVSKKMFLLFINEKTKGFHMRQLFFLHYGCFRILKKALFQQMCTRL